VVNIEGLEALKIISQKNFKERKIILKSPIELGNCKSISLPPLSGQMTDLNIWSRPLIEDEVKEFMEFCNSEVVLHYPLYVLNYN
jgi:hypothetical protein